MEDAWELCETFQDFSVLFPKKSLIERSMRNILQFPKTIHFYLQGAGDISCNEASSRVELETWTSMFQEILGVVLYHICSTS